MVEASDFDPQVFKPPGQDQVLNLKSALSPAVPAVIQRVTTMLQFPALPAAPGPIDVEALVDTGADVNFIDRDFLILNGIRPTKLTHPIPLSMVDSTRNAAVTHVVKLLVCFDRFRETLTFCVFPLGCFQAILSRGLGRRSRRGPQPRLGRGRTAWGSVARCSPRALADPTHEDRGCRRSRKATVPVPAQTRASVNKTVEPANIVRVVPCMALCVRAEESPTLLLHAPVRLRARGLARRRCGASCGASWPKGHSGHAPGYGDGAAVGECAHGGSRVLAAVRVTVRRAEHAGPRARRCAPCSGRHAVLPCGRTGGH